MSLRKEDKHQLSILKIKSQLKIELAFSYSLIVPLSYSLSLPLDHFHKHIPRDTHFPHHFHLLFSLLLLLQQFLLTRNISSITLRYHILAHRRNCLTSNHLNSDTCLERDREHMLRNQFFKFFDQISSN